MCNRKKILNSQNTVKQKMWNRYVAVKCDLICISLDVLNKIDLIMCLELEILIYATLKNIQAAAKKIEGNRFLENFDALNILVSVISPFQNTVFGLWSDTNNKTFPMLRKK